MNPFRWSFRAQAFVGLFVCVALLAYAYYEQFAMGIEPCPLCIFQRLALLALALVYLVAGVHAPRAAGRRVYGLVSFAVAMAGVGIAAYHLWVQHKGPDPMAGCMPGWNYMVENYSLKYAWSKTIEQAFTGHADCAQINWTFLGQSMPFWTLVCFVVIGVSSLWAGMRRRAA